MKITLPRNVRFIIDKLQDAGFEAYAVGGCVRDVLLGKDPNDWDITTDASPYEVKPLFRRTIDTGIQHGTVTVMLNDENGEYTGYEVTTYRIDGEYEDCRHPKEVTYTKELREDLRRRDFTINAMAYNERSGLVDIFGGQ
ncbi:MAG: polynucleotide adenylyltransferase, partial [Lachnospiraceae bacterium]|nr:polynucleotide adenylyltransferase [Lachnospiraceae bacterium]